MFWAWTFLAVLAVASVINLAMGLRTGEMWAEYSKISRRDKPRLFVALMAFQVGMLLFAVILVLFFWATS